MNHKSVFRSLVARRFTAAGVCAVLTAGVLTVSWLQHADTRPAAAAESSSDGVADTEAEARAEAAASGQAVEVLSARAERRDVMANPDGTFTATEYTQPVRTLKNGTWVVVDPTLQVLSDGRIAPVASTIDMRFSGGGTDPLAVLGKAGRSVGFGWDGVLPAPTLNGATATYANVLPDVDLIVKATADGFSHTLVVKTAAAAANPAVTSIDMPMTTVGTTVGTTASGGVEITDAATGGVMFAADAPAMWDSSSQSASGQEGPLSATADGVASDRAEVGVAVDADSLTLTPDQALLTGEGTVYPVFIDPVYSDEYRSAWTMVDSGYPSEEYWKFDGEPDEGLGRCPYTTGTCNSSLVKRLYYQFSSLSVYKGRTILSAEFAVTLRHNWSSSDTSDRVNLYKSSKSISSGTNWSNKPAGTYLTDANTPAPSGSSCALSTDHGTEFNIKSTMASVASAGTGTLTLEMRNDNESDYTKWMRFCPNGHLRIQYNTPPSQPTYNHISSNPGGVCVTSAADAPYSNKLPVLSAYLYDPDQGKTNEWNGGGTVSEQLQGQFTMQWTVGGVTTNWTSDWTSWKASGSKFSVDLATAVNKPTPPDNVVINWAVRAQDAYTPGPWSWDGTPVGCKLIIDATAPDPPIVETSDFPDNDTWLPMVGETGTFTFASTSTDVSKFTYTFNDGTTGTLDAVANPTTGRIEAVLSWMPTTAGAKILTVYAIDSAGNKTKSPASHTTLVYPAAATGDWTLADPTGSSQAVGRPAAGTDPGSPAATAGSGVTFGVPGPAATTDPGAPAAPTAVHLDGTDAGWLEAPSGLTTIGDGFAVSAWVRITDATRDQTAVSLDGPGTPGFVLGYDADTHSWVFAIADTPIQAFAPFEATSTGVDAGQWTHLTGMFDPRDNKLRLSVNGQDPDTTSITTDVATRGTWWDATGTVQIGRNTTGFAYENNWSGDIAEVKVFNRTVLPAEAASLMALTPERTAYWQFSEQPDAGSTQVPEATGNPDLAMTLTGGASIYSPNPDDVELGLADPALIGAGHLALDGIDGAAGTSGTPLDTTGSFAIATRVRLAALPSADTTVLSIPGANTTLLWLGYSAADGTWQVRVTDADSATATVTTLSNDKVLPSTDQAGQFLAVVYNAFTDELTLQVTGDDAVAVATQFTGTGKAALGLAIGREVTADGGGRAYYSGVIDDVRCFDGVVSPDLLVKLADTSEHPEL